MKRTALTLALSLALPLAIGCGKKGDEGKKAPPPEPAKPVETPPKPVEVAPTEPPTPEDFEEQATQDVTDDNLEKAVKELEEELED